MAGYYSIGLDFGTNSVRALIVDNADGRELASYSWNYAFGKAGILLDPAIPDLARQHPADYVAGINAAVKQVLEFASTDEGFSARKVIGIGVDTTGSTPIPVDANGSPLSLSPAFATNPDAMAWLWKDHTAHAEAEEITALAARERPAYLAKCGGRYSSEWFWAKLLHCARVAPDVFEAAHTWVELADWIPALLTNTEHPTSLRRGICAAGHKAFYNAAWGGYPDAEFLAKLHPGLARVRRTLPNRTATIAEAAGGLSEEWAKRLGLAAEIPVAVGAFDAHMGAVGAGVGEGTLVKIMGTSTCDIMVSSLDRELCDVPGLCGIVQESVLPGFYGLEAGQSAVGDIFNWWVGVIKPGGEEGSHEKFTQDAAKLKPGQSGLLALDWHNGNRTVLVDQRLSGMLLGLSLHSTPAEIYRALIESTAFGARVIAERFEEFGVPVKRVVNCGGIAARNPLVMQIYADVLNRPVTISRSTQTCALGAAIAGAVVAGTDRGGHANYLDAIAAMAGVQETVYSPIPANVTVYEELYRLYRQLHDSFGIANRSGADLSPVMKRLLDLRDRTHATSSAVSAASASAAA
jgi:L-ribulokinase